MDQGGPRRLPGQNLYGETALSDPQFDQISTLNGLHVRFGEPGDAEYLKAWLSDEEVSRDFPVREPKEVEESAKRWVDAYQQQAVLTAIYQRKPVGISILFLQTYERIVHQCMHILLVAKEYRRMGIGSALLEDSVHLAKTRHEIELFHVEVYGDPEIARFYCKRGFEEFARQERWSKEDGTYRERICLEKFI